MNQNCFLIATIFLCGILSSCQDYDGGLADRITNGSPKFDFATTHAITLNIDYGAMSAGAHVSLYLSDPLANATGSESQPEGEPVFSVFLDDAGQYTHSIQLPTYADRLYAYSEAWNAPSLLSSQIEHGAASFHALIGSPYVRQAITRAEGEEEKPKQLIVTQLTTDQYKGTDASYYTINGGWDGYGKYNEDLNGLLSQGEVQVEQIGGLQYLLWGGQNSKPGGLDNSKYLLADGANPNLYIVEEYEKDGVTHRVEDASVYFTFLSEGAWNENTVGYYFYPKDKKPDSFEAIKKYIIIPNASRANEPPFGNKANSYSKFPNENAPVGINTRVQLLYVDDEGNVSRNFPVGTEIGFFVMCDAFRLGSGNGTNSVDGRMTERETGKIQTSGLNIWKSNKEWNSDKKHHYIVLKLVEDGTLVYGVEDGTGDKSYEDVLFTITATPNEAMDTEIELPEENIVDPVLPESQEDKTIINKHTYAFEDMWPNGGDYDINDAVIRHQQALTYSALNYAKEVVDEFTFVQITDRNTAYQDAFAIQLPENHIDGTTYELPDGAQYEAETHSIILTQDVRALYGKTIRMTRTFVNAIRFEDIRDEDYNPYIINMTKGPVYTADNRVEIHLPNHATTSKGLATSETGSPWYITLNGKYPYALSFPDNEFQPTAEGQRIDVKFPKFNSWVESNGTTDTNWYK